MKCFCCRSWILLVSIVLLINLVKASNEDNNNDYDGVIEESTSSELLLKASRDSDIKKSLVFHYFKDGIKTFEDKGLEGNLTDSGCMPSDKYAFLIHGWGQNCDVDWMKQLRKKLTNHRGGCIVCVDYGYYKDDSYIRLLHLFRPMTTVITAKLQQLKSQGLDAKESFIFGFSLGGQMATAIGKLFGPKVFKQIDTCDMAGPGFDFRRIASHRESAEQVNCWHTSRNKGTRFYSCHQNVRFGNCGHNQPGENSAISSHGLCVQYYINAFDYPFYAGLQPNRCISRNPAISLPVNYTVGYKENIASLIHGEIFVPTGSKFPYNLPMEQVLRLNNQLRDNSLPSSKSESYRRRFPIFLLNVMNRLIQGN